MAKRTSTTSVVDKKFCPKCGRSLPLTQFYPNRAWKEQVYHDAWCKDCAQREGVTEEGLKAYCLDNNRGWVEECYEMAVRKARNVLTANPKYASAKDKAEIEGKTICNAFFGICNLRQYYKYEDHAVSFPTEQPNKEVVEREEEEQKKQVYSKRWRGYFTPEQIDILEEIYAQYDRDFDLSDVSLQDYAMKVAKASFHADQVYDRMRRGDATSSEYKDAQKIFDDLSKSSNFAACKRKPGETTGMGSLGEIILCIEGTGKLNIDGDVWPQDSVDAAISEYRHALVAAGREGAF